MIFHAEGFRGIVNSFIPADHAGGRDFRGRGLVHAGTPLCDIKEMSAPICYVSRSIIRDPTEIVVQPGRAVAGFRSRAQPHRIVQLGRGLGEGFRAVEPTIGAEFSGHGHLNHLQIADVAIAHPFAGQPGLHAGTAPHPALQNPLIFFHRIANRPAIRDAGAEWLFGVKILSRSGGGGGDAGVPVVRSGIHHGIHILAGQHFAVVKVYVAIFQLHKITGSRAMVSVDITDGNHFQALISQERF